MTLATPAGETASGPSVPRRWRPRRLDVVLVAVGTIMAIGVAVANAILLVTFAEQNRRSKMQASIAARNAAGERLRPVLMTSLAMITGMLPMALGIGRGSAETAPLGRAVIGGLIAATLTTLLVLPAVFAAVQARSGTKSPSLDPADPDSALYHPDAALLA